MASETITNAKTPEELVQTLTEANQTIMARQAKLVLQLKKDKEQFLFYAESHKQKNTKDGDAKAETNLGYAAEIEALLTQEKLA